MSSHRWDVARTVLTCIRGGEEILEGEQNRHFGPTNKPVCIACAKTATGEDPPPDMPAIPRLPTLKPPQEWFQPTDFCPAPPQIPILASKNHRERILRARRRLDAPPAVVRDWWND